MEPEDPTDRSAPPPKRPYEKPAISWAESTDQPGLMAACAKADGDPTEPCASGGGMS